MRGKQLLQVPGCSESQRFGPQCRARLAGQTDLCSPERGQVTRQELRDSNRVRALLVKYWISQRSTEGDAPPSPTPTNGVPVTCKTLTRIHQRSGVCGQASWGLSG